MELMVYLTNNLNLSPEQGRKLDSLFKTEQVAKGDQLLKPSNLSQKLVFVEKGLIRTYYLKDGKDITHLFFAEDSFSIPIESVFYNKRSPYGWESLEKGQVRTANYKDIEPFFSQIPGFEEFVRALLIDVLRLLSDRIYAIQFQSAQERYRSLMEKHPDILLRSPLGHIASYLGITQQTLSVIRAAK